MQNKIKISNYEEVLREFSETYDFLERKEILGIERLDSLWRKENLLLKVDCLEQSYVFKKINGEEKQSEIERVKLFKEEYNGLMPEIFVFEDSAYLMQYIDGDSFFNLAENERIKRIDLAGKVLSETYSGRDYSKVDISNEVRRGFEIYREKRKRFFQEDELRLVDFSIFNRVSNQPSHNDLNAANLLYSEQIKLIDPSDEGFNDIARDVGRYCASCFLNNYDYFGNDKKQSLEIAEAFLGHFGEETLERAKYFIGESFLAFLNFDTVSVPKKVLKRLSMNILEKKGKIINILEDSLSKKQCATPH